MIQKYLRDSQYSGFSRELSAPDLNAPILTESNIEALQRFEGELTIISHPAFWRSANPQVRTLAREVYRRQLDPEHAELEIKQGMIQTCYGKGFLHEARFEATLLKAQIDLRPVLITIDFYKQCGNNLALNVHHEANLSTYLNWCIGKYSAGNIFIVPTRHNTGHLLNNNTARITADACRERPRIMLHGGIIDQCLLQTAQGLYEDRGISSKMALDDNLCYSSTGGYIPFNKLGASTYFNDGLQAWSKLKVNAIDPKQCDATINFKASLPKVKIVY